MLLTFGWLIADIGPKRHHPSSPPWTTPSPVSPPNPPTAPTKPKSTNASSPNTSKKFRTSSRADLEVVPSGRRIVPEQLPVAAVVVGVKG